jgi:hypothetical protein
MADALCQAEETQMTKPWFLAVLEGLWKGISPPQKKNFYRVKKSLAFAIGILYYYGSVGWGFPLSPLSLRASAHHYLVLYRYS